MLNVFQNNMLLLRLKGGLGNQLFQYAAAFSIARRWNKALTLDTRTGFSQDLRYKREYRLHHFSIQAPVASDTAVRQFVAARLLRFGMKTTEEMWRARLGRAYNPLFSLLVRCNLVVSIEGYWQSERFFHEDASEVKKEFRITTPADVFAIERARRITSQNAVAIHVRRRDYPFHCGPDYYLQAIHLMRSLVDHPVFFAFSDEPGWLPAVLGREVTIEEVSHPGPDADIHELRLMSLCNHHIIANSSYSWWGAWLGKGLSQKVISPSAGWGPRGLSLKDAVPSRWISI